MNGRMRSRIQDALRATRSAASQGLLAGGGVALIQASKALDQVEVASDEEKFGVDILRKALEEPMRALCSNAGYNGDVEVAKALEAEPGYGLDCETGKYAHTISWCCRSGEGNGDGSAGRRIRGGADPHHELQHHRSR